VVEFGLRRAQGIDGGLSAARAAYIGGCAGTSNVLAGQMLGVPVKGTHAHSWVMSFENERDAFFAYARAMPENCILLVDTYDTIQGIANAIEVGKWLRENGHQLTGIRLDSGDLSQLSKQGRKMLDEAGLDKTVILASGDLDEYLITSLNRQQAPIDLWGVGTKLVTAFDEPALGGVYKLSASRQPGGQWQHRIKVSEQTIKSNVPGLLNVRRFVSEGMFVADMIYDELQPPQGDLTIVDPADSTQRRSIPSDQEHHDVLVPVFEQGQCVYQSPSLKQLQERAHQQRTSLHPAIRRFENPHRYDAGLEASLFDLRQDLIVAHRSE
jgi:nicotinate phosphoribosyltransferase